MNLSLFPVHPLHEQNPSDVDVDADVDHVNININSKQNSKQPCLHTKLVHVAS